MSVKCCWFLLFLLPFCTVHKVASTQRSHRNKTESTFPTPSMAGLQKCLFQGGITGLVNCAGERTLKMIDNMAKEHTIHILPQVTLIDDRKSRSIDVVNYYDLPSDPAARSSKILDYIMQAITKLASGRIIKIKIPVATTENVARSLEEGRAKLKKVVGSLAMDVGAKMFTVLAVITAGLALLTTKALIVSKLAFVVSLILFVRLILSQLGPNSVPPYIYGYNGPNGYPNYDPPYYGSSLAGWNKAQYPYARSIDASSNERKDNAINSD